MTPGELAEHEKVQPPSMTRVIAVLEERSLVLRSPHPTDRRQVILTVTGEGRAVVQRVRRRKDAWLARRLAELTTEERADAPGGGADPGEAQPVVVTGPVVVGPVVVGGVRSGQFASEVYRGCSVAPRRLRTRCTRSAVHGWP